MQRLGASNERLIRALALMCLAALALAAAPPKVLHAPRPVEGDLSRQPAAKEFALPVVHVVPEHYTLQVFGAFFAPRTGPWAAAGALFAGEDTRYKIWLLDGVLTGRQPRIACGASTLFLNAAQFPGTAPLVAPASLLAGHHFNCWAIQDIHRFRRLPREMLLVVKDLAPIVKGDIETDVYDRVLEICAATSPQAFRNVAREDLTGRQLLADPKAYRGEVISVEGILKLVVRHTPTPGAAMANVGNIYEAWIQPERMGSQIMVAVFTDWPDGLPRDLLGKELSKSDRVVRVRFAGYFFKSFQYDAIDRTGRVKRIAPMLIGSSLELPSVAEKPREAMSPWIRALVYGVPAMFVGLIFVVVGLTYWFRRTDDLVQKRLLAARNRELVLPAPDVVPVAAPVAAPIRPARAAAFPSRTSLPPRSGRQGRSDDTTGPAEGGDKPPGEDAGG